MRLEGNGMQHRPDEEKPAEQVLIDGYNLIGFLQQDAFARMDLSEQRDVVIHHAAEYAGYTGYEVLVVFDGHKVKRNPQSIERRFGITIVYTRTNQTADMFIERYCQENHAERRRIRVVTADSLEQSLILSAGALRMPPHEFMEELSRLKEEHQKHAQNRPRGFLTDRVDPSIRKTLEELRTQESKKEHGTNRG